jgi:alkanesulfonate monooxygenase SsuD/methylene tetrahydromethanopterin reductase-like flavin-dependent oxidoreductase (luciferase family)
VWCKLLRAERWQRSASLQLRAEEGDGFVLNGQRPDDYAQYATGFVLARTDCARKKARRHQLHPGRHEIARSDGEAVLTRATPGAFCETWFENAGSKQNLVGDEPRLTYAKALLV